MVAIRLKRFEVPRKSWDERAKWREVASALDERLDSLGKVMSVITYQQATKMIRCYGHFIPASRLFAVLNLSTNHSIRYHSLGKLTDTRVCRFVRLQKFEPRYDDDRWVGLVNIDMDD